MIWLVLMVAAECLPCHRDVVEAWEKSPMARSSGPVRGMEGARFRHEASKTEYGISAAGKVTIRTPEQRAEQQLHYFVGSGAHGRSYLFWRGDKLFQAPITWYRQRGWDMSPGYEQDRHSDWSRPITRECLWCHASGTRAVYGTVNTYATPPFSRDGVTCERCHAATAEHWTNPAKMAGAERADTCRQCHLQGESRVNRPGRSFFEYRPGMRLDELVTYSLKPQRPESDLQTTGHFERLARSRCQLVSGVRLWCGSCHEPHAKVRRGPNESCVGCHAEPVCRRGPDCVGCHMPKSRAPDSSHGVFTDHWIRVVSQ